MENTITDQLIQLSRIFKQGFTVELKNGDINQYTNYKKLYIVSYKTIIRHTVHYLDPPTIFYPGLIKDNCIIGGWLNPYTDTYYIELCKTYKLLKCAIKYAIKHKQEFIYNIKTGGCIKL